MAAFDLRKFGVVLADLPDQPVRQIGEDGRPFEVTGREMAGDHRVVIVAIDEDGSSIVGCPLTSAKNAAGREKEPRKTWLRVVHEKEPAYVQVEQIRFLCRERILSVEEPLGEYDSRKLEERLKFLFQLV